MGVPATTGIFVSNNNLNLVYHNCTKDTRLNGYDFKST